MGEVRYRPARENVQGDRREVDDGPAQQDHGVPPQPGPPDQEPAQEGPDTVGAFHDGGRRERRHNEAVADEDGQEAGTCTAVQPCESAAAHRSIGQVQANISTKPPRT